jgi:hypothetical protein
MAREPLPCHARAPGRCPPPPPPTCNAHTTQRSPAPRQVEVNTIASSFAALSQRVTAMHKCAAPASPRPRARRSRTSSACRGEAPGASVEAGPRPLRPAAPLPSRTNWTRLVPSSRTNWTRLRGARRFLLGRVGVGALDAANCPDNAPVAGIAKAIADASALYCEREGATCTPAVRPRPPPPPARPVRQPRRGTRGLRALRRRGRSGSLGAGAVCGAARRAERV